VTHWRTPNVGEKSARHRQPVSVPSIRAARHVHTSELRIGIRTSGTPCRRSHACRQAFDCAHLVARTGRQPRGTSQRYDGGWSRLLTVLQVATVLVSACVSDWPRKHGRFTDIPGKCVQGIGGVAHRIIIDTACARLTICVPNTLGHGSVCGYRRLALRMRSEGMWLRRTLERSTTRIDIV
jgi:hypothetical protein